VFASYIRAQLIGSLPADLTFIEKSILREGKETTDRLGSTMDTGSHGKSLPICILVLREFTGWRAYGLADRKRVYRFDRREESS
jgi:hypothetical protein